MTNIIEAMDFKIVKCLGQGTFGTVYLCDNSQYKRCCVKAIEIREKNESRHYNHLAMIKQEVHMLKHMEHPRIIKMLEHFRSKRFCFIVTDYIPNGTLSQLIDEYNDQQKKFSQGEIMKYFCDILSALEYLKCRCVVHGDLKCENILIGSDGRIKISDFGVSRCVAHSIDQDALCHSTPLYTPPEALFDKTKYTYASDIWSLGCIFYELCMLHHPFNRVYDINELYQLSSRSIYQTIDYERKNYSRDVMTLSDMMLQPNVAKRATISQIVAQPIVTIRYYENYFDMGNLSKTAVQS